MHVGVESDRDSWVLSVTNNGIGFAPENLEKVFDIFKRLHGRSEYFGAGIELQYAVESSTDLRAVFKLIPKWASEAYFGFRLKAALAL